MITLTLSVFRMVKVVHAVSQVSSIRNTTSQP